MTKDQSVEQGIIRPLMGLSALWSLGYLYSVFAHTGTDVYGVAQTDVLLFAAIIAGCIIAAAMGAESASKKLLSAVCLVSGMFIVIGIVLTMAYVHASLSPFILLIAKTCVGVGQGVLYVFWGYAISLLEIERVESVFFCLIPTVAFLLLAFIGVRLTFGESWIATAVYMILLLVLSAALFLARSGGFPSPDGIEAEPETQKTEPSLKELMVSFIALTMMYASMSAIWVVSLSSFMLGLSMSAVTFAVGAVAAFVLIWASLRWTKRLDFSTLTRWTMPIAILGALAASLGGTPGYIASQICFIIVNIALELLGRLLVMHMAKRSPELRWQIIATGFLTFPLGGMVGLGIWRFTQTSGLFLGPIPIILTALALFAISSSVVGAQEPKPESVNLDQGISPVIDPLDKACEDLRIQKGLSDRESEVFALLARGRSRTFIRESLFISRGTVDAHITHIYQKIGVGSKDELMALLDEMIQKQNQSGSGY